MGDQSIPAADWPALLDRLNQVTAIFDGIPFPPVDDYFIRCARGIPINKGMSIANPRFYTDTFNQDYWPRPDWRIEADMAIQYMDNIEAIVNCIEHKIASKVREIEGSVRAWRLMSLATTFVLAPLAAGAAPTLLATEAAEFGYQAVTGSRAGTEVGVVVTSGVSVIQADPSALEGLIQLGLERILSEKIEGLNPVTQQIIMAAIPALAAAAATDVLTGVFPNVMAATTAATASTLANVSSSVMSVAIGLLGDVIEAEGATGVETLQSAVFGLQNMDATMVPFTVWVWDTILLAYIFDAATQMMEDEIPMDGEIPPDGDVPPDVDLPTNGDDLPDGSPIDDLPSDGGVTPDGQTPIGDFDVEDDIVDPLVERAEDAGIEVSRPGGNTLAIAGAGVGGLVLIGLALGVFGK